MHLVSGEKRAMKPRAIYLLTVLIIVFGFTLAAPKRAVADDEDPPSRVARLSSALRGTMPRWFNEIRSAHA